MAQWRIIRGLSPYIAYPGYRIEKHSCLFGWVCKDWFPSLKAADRRLDQFLGRVKPGDVVRQESD